MNKQEAIDVLEVYKRNMAHILGDSDEKVKVIETCIMLVSEIEDTGNWILTSESLPKLSQGTKEGYHYSEDVLGMDEGGKAVVCSLYEDGNFCDDYGDVRDVVKWMPIPD